MARKYKSSRKYSYNSDSKNKKVLLIVLAVVLALAAIAAVVFFIFGGKDDTNTNTGSFSLTALPDKTTFTIGEPASWHGLKALLKTAEGNFVVLGPESCTITGFDSSVPANDQVITVKYKNYSATFTIDIIDPNAPQNPTNPDGSVDPDAPQNPNNPGNNEDNPDSPFVGMSFKTMPKTEYKVGDWLSVKNGVLLLEYKNGETREIKMRYDLVHDFTSAKPGTYTLTVIYEEDGHRAKLTYDITVTE